MLNIVKKERIAFMSTFIVTAGIVLLDLLTAVDINSNALLFILIYIAICALLLMICQYLFGELSQRFIWLLFAVIFCVCFGMALLTWRNDWKTQTIIYRNAMHSNETIEYRMRVNHSGYLYDRQIVYRRKIMPYMDYIMGADTAGMDQSKWVRVDEKVNEMELPGEYVDLPISR